MHQLRNLTWYPLPLWYNSVSYFSLRFQCPFGDFFLLLSFAFSIAFLTPLLHKYLSFIKIYTNAGLFDFAYIVMYRSNWTLKGSVTCWKFSCKLSCSAVVHCQSLKWRQSAATHHVNCIKRVCNSTFDQVTVLMLSTESWLTICMQES